MIRLSIKHFSIFVVELAVLFAAASSSHAQFAKPDDAVKYRQSALFVMAQHFGRVAAMAQGKMPFDAKTAQDNADVAVALSKLPWAGFVVGAESKKAKSEIWKESAKFKDLSEKMQAEMVKLQAASKTGNLDNIKLAVGEVGKSCKTCHDAYRE